MRKKKVTLHVCLKKREKETEWIDDELRNRDEQVTCKTKQVYAWINQWIDLMSRLFMKNRMRKKRMKNLFMKGMIESAWESCLSKNYRINEGEDGTRQEE